MPDAVTRGKSSTTTQRAPQPRRDGGAAPYITVRYWKRMRINKVYPVIVSFAGRGDAEPVTVRVVVAGAQVVPAEQTMDPSNTAEKATFYVTPLAYGGLRGERVEILQNGRKIQEVRLPCKVTSQKGTLVWLFLALFLPWLMLHYFQYAPVGYRPGLDNEGNEKYVQQPWKNYPANFNKVDKAGKEILVKDKPVVDPERKSRVITDFMDDNTPDLKEILGLEEKSDMVGIYTDVREFPEKAYLRMFDKYHDLKLPLPLIVFLALLFMTFISFLARTEARKTVKGKPLPT